MSSYYESLDEESQLYYDRKLTTADGKKLPDPMSLKDWKNNVALLPDVNWPDIYNFLVNTPSEYIRNVKQEKISVAPLMFCVKS